MDFLGIGPVELLVIALVAFLFLGPARMVEVSRSLGKILREIRRTTNELPKLLSLDEPLDQPPKDRSRDWIPKHEDAPSDTQPKETDER